MAKELTYILGAGASYQSIPIVKTFNNRFLQFSNYLRIRAGEYNGDNKKKYIHASNSIKELYKEFSSHQSFDTYFKKLFHFGDTEKINNGKRLLNLYFLWEHSTASLTYHDDLGKEEFKKQSLFDKRYDALIAGILKPIAEKSHPLCDVNFISWNYDINLLHSIKNFFYPRLTYISFINKIKTNQFSWEIDEKIKITNINGYFYSSGLNEITNLGNCNIQQIIDKKIYSNYYIDTTIDEDADRIRFAWELNSKDEENLKTSLGSIIAQTENLIIIGYTFPIYNRFIDFGYINQEDLVKKKIVIQDPQAEILSQNLLDIYKMQKSNMQIQPISNCDSFYVPSSIFGISDYK